MPAKKPFITIDCEMKNKNLYDCDLISPNNLNEKEICNSLDYFSTNAPKKKLGILKKNGRVESLKNKRKRLENYFSTIDLDSFSDYVQNKNDQWHDDLHYIVLKHQKRSNFLHLVWLFVAILIICILLIIIASTIYSNNNLLKHNEQRDSYEVIQQFIQDFNSTKHKQFFDKNYFNYNEWLQKRNSSLYSNSGLNQTNYITKKSLNSIINQALNYVPNHLNSTYTNFNQNNSLDTNNFTEINSGSSLKQNLNNDSIYNQTNSNFNQTDSIQIKFPSLLQFIKRMI